MLKNHHWVFVLTAAFLAATAVFLFLRQSDSGENPDKEFDSQSSLYEQLKPQENTDSGTDGDTDYLAGPRKINPDTVAWLTIPDTAIDFPVVQSEENEFYLNHDFEKNSSVYGVPFLDYRCNADFTDFNSIIYSHNIKGERMFAGLLRFQEEDYFDSHSCGYMTTEHEQYKINFIACLITESDSFIYNTVFLTEKEKIDFLNSIEKNAVQSRDFSDLQNGKIVTLSTCSYEFENARTVLIGYFDESDLY